MPRTPAAFHAMRARQLQRLVTYLKKQDPQNELLGLVTADDISGAARLAEIHPQGEEEEERWPETWEQPGCASFKVFLYRHFRGWAGLQRARDEYDGPSKGTRSQVAARRAAMEKQMHG